MGVNEDGDKNKSLVLLYKMAETKGLSAIALFLNKYIYVNRLQDHFWVQTGYNLI